MLYEDLFSLLKLLLELSDHYTIRFLLDFSLIGLDRFAPNISFSFSRALGLSAALRMNWKTRNGLPTPDGRVTEGEWGDVLEKLAFRPVELGVRGVEGTGSKLP